MRTSYSDNIEQAKRSCSHLNKPMSERELSDYAPFFNSLADTVVLESASPDGFSVTQGKEAVVRSITAMYSELSRPENEEDIQLERPIEFIGANNIVITLWKECTKNIRTGEVSNSKEVVVVMEFEHGLIARIRRFSQ